MERTLRWINYYIEGDDLPFDVSIHKGNDPTLPADAIAVHYLNHGVVKVWSAEAFLKHLEEMYEVG